MSDGRLLEHTFGRGHPVRTRIRFRRSPQCTRHGLKNRFDDVVRISAMVQDHVKVECPGRRRGSPELLGERRMKRAQCLARHVHIPDQVRPAAQIDRRRDQRIVHRHRCAPIPTDATFVAQRLGQGTCRNKCRRLPHYDGRRRANRPDISRSSQTTRASPDASTCGRRSRHPSRCWACPGRPVPRMPTLMLVSFVLRSICAWRDMAFVRPVGSNAKQLRGSSTRSRTCRSHRPFPPILGGRRRSRDNSCSVPEFFGS